MVPAPSGPAVLAAIYTLIAIAAIVISARVYLRLVIQRTKLLPSDLLMISAWCSAFATASFDIVLEIEGVLRPEIDYSLTNYEAKQKNFEYVLKMIWASVIPFFTTFYLCKASLLFMYLQLFPRFMKKRRIALWATIIYCAVAYIVSMSLQLFLCFPIQRNWDLSAPQYMCDVSVVTTIFQVSWALHFTGSIALFISPFLVVHNLQMKPRVKIGVYCVFLLGIIDIAFSLTRFLSVQLSNDDDFRSITLVELWSALDAYIGLLIACLPSLRPYLKKNIAASYDYTYGNSSRPTRSTPRRRPDQSEFAELDETPYPSSAVGPHLQPSSDATVDDSWNEDKKSNRSDVELVNLNGKPPVHEQSHV
ncbi:hypothetical protein B0J13DRAFT_585862 [Dactylonectria estremocensis]|uniref:Rhodopsin domain-containing protein n=1 Tax=Dactylonectria estremocensis TaxID=1079267 RepID=A0A9P9J499_9HYPO|nr:hypothetical protein B0J13DRAFT_585862 [Dactylonectria estremocensis]